MTLDEAITVLENEVRVAEVNGRPLEVKAFQIGIGAIQQIAQMRLLDISPIAELLPGETT